MNTKLKSLKVDTERTGMSNIEQGILNDEVERKKPQRQRNIEMHRDIL
jgi:hypothetical protein